MEEIEASTENLEETIHHEAGHELSNSGGHGAHTGWISRVALTSALLAVLAAVTALLSNHHANEAMLEQIKASDLWNYYQAKGIKASVLSSKVEIVQSLGKRVDPNDIAKLSDYKKEQTEISEQAKEKEQAAERHLSTHSTFARGVTLFQVAIGVAAVAILSRRRKFWLASLGFAAVGVAFLIQGLLS